MFVTKTDYTSQSGTTVADLPYRIRYCTEKDSNNSKCNWQDLYGIGGNGGGTSYGFLGDLHSVGDGSLTVTYGIKPANVVWHEFSQSEVTKNQLDFARINANGEVTLRRILFQPEGRVGTGNYTQYQPYERLAWVKSAMVGSGSRYIIFFRTETSDGAATNPRYTEGQVRMMQVDKEGIITQKPTPISASASFNRADEVEVLANGTLAWTYTGHTDGNLRLNLWPLPAGAQSWLTTPPIPLAKTGDTISYEGFTAHWSPVADITGYKLDVSSNNFQTTNTIDVPTDSTSYRVNGLQVSTAYKYRVRAIKSAGESPNSNVIDVRTIAHGTIPPLAGSCANAHTSAYRGWTEINKFEIKDAQGNILLANIQNQNDVQYEDFTNQIIKVTAGSAINYLAEQRGNTKLFPFEIYIDRDGNGVIDLSDQIVSSNPGHNFSSGPASMMIPADLPIGFYRFRIRRHGWHKDQPCKDDPWSTVDDYMLEVISTTDTGTGTSTETDTGTGTDTGSVVNDCEDDEILIDGECEVFDPNDPDVDEEEGDL